MSSANKNDKRFEELGRSLIKQRKRIGPRIVPCKTDMSMVSGSESSPFR